MPTEYRFADDIAEEIIREIAVELEVGMSNMETDAKRNAVADTGNLARRIHSGVKVEGNQLIGVLWTTSGYAVPVELGSGLWGPKKDYIYPKTAKVLAWRGKEDDQSNIDGWIFAKRVSGHPPQPFMKPAIDKNIPKMMKKFKQIVTRVGLPPPKDV